MIGNSNHPSFQLQRIGGWCEPMKWDDESVLELIYWTFFSR